MAFQRKLATSRWPEGLPVRVRAGLHSGEVSVSEGLYVGFAVHGAARAHGLKGIPNPVDLIQIEAEGLLDDFPIVRTQAAG